MAVNQTELTDAVIAQKRSAGYRGAFVRKNRLFLQLKTTLEHHIQAREQARLRGDTTKVAEHSRAVTIADYEVGKYAHRHADILNNLIDVNLAYPAEKMLELKNAVNAAMRSQK